MTIHSQLRRAITGDEALAFDAFMASSPFAAYQQSRAWAAALPSLPRRDHLFFTATGSDGIVGGAVIRRTRLAGHYWLATIQRGPIVARTEDLPAVMDALMTCLATTGCCSVQLAPRVRGRELPAMCEAMRAAGFSPLPDRRQPLHSATAIVWLDKPEDAVLAGFKQRGRRQLKAGSKAGVRVRPVTGSSDITAYQRVIDAFRATRPDYDMSGLPDAAGQADLIASLGGAMLLAERDGTIIGGHAFVRQADEAIWLSMATTADDPAIPRAYCLLWEGMRLARTMGCVGYDLAGIPMDEPVDAGEANRLQFKNAFAPSRRVLPPMHVAPVKVLPHAMLFGARQLYRALRSPPVARAAS